MVRSAEKPASRRLVVERYTWLERVTHLVHLISMFVLLITGFKIYTGWGFMSFESARALHMIAVPFSLSQTGFLSLTIYFPAKKSTAVLETAYIISKNLIYSEKMTQNVSLI